MKVRFAVLMLLALLAPGALVWGQRHFDRHTRSVHGRVVDKQGNVLPGSVVQIENERTLAVASFIVQKDGRYYFHELSTELDFTLKAHYRKKWSKSKLLSRFSSDSDAEVDLTIPTE